MDQSAQAGPKTNGLGRDSVENILLLDNKINKDQFDRVRLEAINKGELPEKIILAHNYAAAEDVAKAKAEVLVVPYLSLSTVAVSPEAMGLIPESVAKRYKVLPFVIDKTNGILSVAMAHPEDLATVDFLQTKAAMKIKPFMTVEAELMEAIETRYSQSLSTEVSAALKEGGVEDTGVRTVSSASLGEVIKEAPIAKIVTTVLEFAIKSRASDVHIEPQEMRTRVRYRIDGILQEKLVLPKNVHEAVISRIKILCGMKIDEKRVPQDGRFNFVSGEEEVDLRVSSLPTVNGEKIVMRLLKKSGKVPTLGELGIRGRALKDLETAAHVPHGIVLVTGPTGSGKTTTLYALMTEINTPKVNIVTLEDPVEYQMEGVNQVQINVQAGLTFASGLRSFLRQDPNVIMVGEIRDEETAALAVQASLTGHMVFSTLHTNSSAGALPRLLDMKAEPYLLASSITAIVGQRVVRKVCPTCIESFVPTKEMVDEIKKILGGLFDAWVSSRQAMIEVAKKAGAEFLLYRGSGNHGTCPQCGGSGYVGRVGIYEVMPMTTKLGKMVMERVTASDIEKVAVTDGMILMQQDGYLKALDGITTLDEVLRVAQS